MPLKRLSLTVLNRWEVVFQLEVRRGVVVGASADFGCWLFDTVLPNIANGALSRRCEENRPLKESIHFAHAAAATTRHEGLPYAWRERSTLQTNEGDAWPNEDVATARHSTISHVASRHKDRFVGG